LFIERKFYDFAFVRMINVMTSLLEVSGLTVELSTVAYTRELLSAVPELPRA